MRALCGALVLLVVVCVALGLPSGHHKHNHHHHKDFKHTHAHKGHKQVHKTDHVHSHEEFNFEVNVHTAVKNQPNLYTNDAHKAFMVAFLRAVLTRDKTVDFVHGTGKLHGGGEPAWKTWIRDGVNPLKVEFETKFVTWDGDTEDRTQVQLTGAAKTSATIYGLDEKEQPLKDMKTAMDKLNKPAARVQARPADAILIDVNPLLPEAQDITAKLNTLNQDITIAEGQIHHNNDATEEDLANEGEILQRIDAFDTRNFALGTAHNDNVEKYNALDTEVDQFSKDIGLVLQLITTRQEATVLITEAQDLVDQARIDAGNLQTAITNAASGHIQAVRRAQDLVDADNALCDNIQAAINAATASRDKFTPQALNDLTHGYKQKLKVMNKGIKDTDTEQDEHSFGAVQARVKALREGFKNAVNKACEEAKQKAVDQGGDEGGNQGGGIQCTIF